MVFGLILGLLVGDVPRLVAPALHLLPLLSVPQASTLESPVSPVTSVLSTGGQDWVHEDSQDWEQHSAKHPPQVGSQC